VGNGNNEDRDRRGDDVKRNVICRVLGGWRCGCASEECGWDMRPQEEIISRDLDLHGIIDQPTARLYTVLAASLLLFRISSISPLLPSNFRRERHPLTLTKRVSSSQTPRNEQLALELSRKYYLVDSYLFSSYKNTRSLPICQFWQGTQLLEVGRSLLLLQRMSPPKSTALVHSH